MECVPEIQDACAEMIDAFILKRSLPETCFRLNAVAIGRMLSQLGLRVERKKPRMQRPRLLVLIPFLTPSIGGGAFVFFRQLPFLKEKYDLRVVYFQPRAAEFIPSDIPSYLLEKNVGKLKFYLQYPNLLWKAVGIFRDFKPDVVLANSYQPFFLFLAARLFSWGRCVLITGEHNNIPEMMRGVRFGGLRKFLIRTLDRFAGQIIVPSNGLRDCLLNDCGLPDEKICVIPNPIVFPGLDDLAKGKAEVAGLAEGEDYILNVGVLDGQKNHRLLLEAFSEVRKSRAVKCVIGGTGSPEKAEALRIYARELGVEKDLVLAGHLSNPFALMARAKAFVLSSDYEGLPYVLVEAMACSCPVVSTDCEYGPREILEHGKTGLLSPVGDAGALAVNILKVLTDVELADRLSKNALESVARYRVETVVAQYAKAIDACLKVASTS
jgi:glycosyltransferase involved in cell wall biosynthesis